MPDRVDPTEAPQAVSDVQNPDTEAEKGSVQVEEDSAPNPREHNTPPETPTHSNTAQPEPQPEAEAEPAASQPLPSPPPDASAAQDSPPSPASPPVQGDSGPANPPPTPNPDRTFEQPAPEAAPTPTAETPPEQPAEQQAPQLDDQTLAAMDAAMQAATAEPPPAPPSAEGAPNADPGHPGLEQAADAAAHAPKRAIRGPRLVQGGREYRKGRVVSVGPEDIFIEFGPKELGVLPRLQYREPGGDEPNLPSPGDEVEVAIQRFEAKESLFICALPGSIQKAEWELLEPGQVVEARVTGHNKGGLELEVANHRAFMPASQVDVHRINDLSIFVGEKIKCVIQKVDRFGKGNIVLTRRELIREELAKQRSELREKLTEGQVVKGTVKKLMQFGAFVDIGGVDALLHVSDMSHDRLHKPEKVVQEGQELKVQVIKLDWENNRHSVGLKQLQDDPFEVATGEIEEGSEVSGRVTKLMEFGAFVELAPGTEGLVHISELDWKRVNKVSDVLQPDQIVKVKVLKIDKSDRKISLSIKQTTEPPKREGGGGRGGGGRGRGRGDRDDRNPDEILKETPQLRRMREKAKQREQQKSGTGKGKGKGAKSGLGDLGDFGGIGLGDLKL